MEEMEVPTEHLHEQIEEHARDGGRWTMGVAISTALMAVLAAITSLQAGHHANEAVIDQIRAADQWTFYQAKGIKAEIAEFSINQVKSLGKVPDSFAVRKLAQYRSDQATISKSARELEQSASHHLQIHMIISKAVTIFQIAIALSAISILVRNKLLWIASMMLSVGGIYFMVLGLISA
jgi:hypothetical protein